MREVKYSPRAQNDLDEIWEYISSKLLNPKAAKDTVFGIMDKADALSDMPQSGTPLYFGSGLFSGYRYITYKNYLAFYRVTDNAVYIDRVIYGKRDYMQLLFNEKEE